MSATMCELVQFAVLTKLNELASLPVGFSSGRRMTADDLRQHGSTLTPSSFMRRCHATSQMWPVAWALSSSWACLPPFLNSSR